MTTAARAVSIGTPDAAEDPLDLEPGRDVLGELVLGHVGDEAGEVDDPLHAGRGRRLAEDLGAPAVLLGEVRAAEPVDQVVDRVDALDGSLDLARVEDVHARPR